MAQLGNTGINGNLMVVGKIVTTNIILNGELNMNGQSIINCNNIMTSQINNRTPLTVSYDQDSKTLTLNGGN